MLTRKLKVASVSLMIKNNAVFLSPTKSSSSSSYMVISRTSLMSKGASLAPQEISMLFAVLPETNCQGLFNQVHKKSTKKAPGTHLRLLALCVEKIICVRLTVHRRDTHIPATGRYRVSNAA